MSLEKILAKMRKKYTFGMDNVKHFEPRMLNVLGHNQIIKKYYDQQEVTDHRAIAHIQSPIASCVKSYSIENCRDCPYLMHCPRAIRSVLRRRGKTELIGAPTNVY